MASSPQRDEPADFPNNCAQALPRNDGIKAARREREDD
jgi:hypothetical protein